jgi:uncharacterized repeat protein (TIGR03806 family)
MDLTQVPYPKLSDYKFFDGDIKNQNPAYGVLPYKPESELFTDYAQKKRFVWMPNGLKATYVNDYSVLELPVGAALIKSFYYNNVQPLNTTRIIETRVEIRKSDGWIYLDYIWNNEQTEAFLNLQGSTTQVTWLENSVEKTVNYVIPSEAQCASCHTISTIKKPIGIKPQNLNNNYAFSNGVSNQLTKWINFGYLENNLPTNIVSVVNYKDTSKPLELRVRSYFDSNCAHCHQDGGYASFFNLKFAFNETVDQTKMGVCVSPNHIIPGMEGRIIKPGNVNQSLLIYRINTNDPSYRMPFLGRTIVQEETVQMVEQWVNSLTDCP